MSAKADPRSEHLEAASLPLAGLRVIDVTANVVGPYATMLLGELGADVIKVERPGSGDDARAWGPPFWDGTSAAFLAFNRNKRSIELDLKTAQGREELHALLRSADVLVHNGLPQKRSEIGLSDEQVRATNPDIIYCSITAYGHVGPQHEWPGYDSLLQAQGGIMSVTGEAGAAPVRVGTSIIDMGTAFWAVIGVLAALVGRANGKAAITQVDASLYETAVAWMNHPLVSYFATGRVPVPAGSGMPMIAPYEAFQASDGMFMLGANNDRLFVKLCAALGSDALARDERFVSNPRRVENRVALREELNRHFAKHTTAGAMSMLREAGVPAAPIQDVASVSADSQAAALGMIREAQHPSISGYREVGLALSLDGRRPPTRMLPPELGEYNDQIRDEIRRS